MWHVRFRVVSWRAFHAVLCVSLWLVVWEMGTEKPEFPPAPIGRFPLSIPAVHGCGKVYALSGPFRVSICNIYMNEHHGKKFVCYDFDLSGFKFPIDLCVRRPLGPSCPSYDILAARWQHGRAARSRREQWIWRGVADPLAWSLAVGSIALGRI